MHPAEPDGSQGQCRAVTTSGLQYGIRETGSGQPCAPAAPLARRMNQPFRGARRRRRLVRGHRPVACAVVVALASFGAASTATAKTTAGDPAVIAEWNALGMSTFVADPTKALQETPLYIAFVQAAVYNAVVGIDGRYEPYRFHAHAPHRTSAQAAAVAAAHEVLVTYSPYAQPTLDAAYAASLAQIHDGKAKTRGIAFGIRAADHLIAQRTNDGRNAPLLFTQPPAPGVWRPTPPVFLPMAVPWMGAVTPLLIPSAASSPNRATAGADLGPLHPRLRRGQGARLGKLDSTNARPDQHRPVLLRQRRRPVQRSAARPARPCDTWTSSTPPGCSPPST